MEHEPLRVLVIDDDDLVRGIVERIVKPLFEETVTVSRGADALAKLQGGERFALVVSDLRMPDVGGLEIVRWIRDKQPTTPLVVITGFADAVSEAEVRELGVELVYKPFGALELRAAVARALGG